MTWCLMPEISTGHHNRYREASSELNQVQALVGGVGTWWMVFHDSRDRYHPGMLCVGFSPPCAGIFLTRNQP